MPIDHNLLYGSSTMTFNQQFDNYNTYYSMLDLGVSVTRVYLKYVII